MLFAFFFFFQFPVGPVSIDFVILSAYKITLPLTFLAALPMVWIKDLCERKNPSLSASQIATNAHSGISSPSLSKFIPINIS